MNKFSFTNTLRFANMHFPFKLNNKTKKYGLFPFTQPQVLIITHMQRSKRKCCKEKVFASFMYMCTWHVDYDIVSL